MRARDLALLGLGVGALLIGGCAAVPFREVDLVSVQGIDPALLREQFALALPVKFRVVNSVAFEFKGHAFAAIGLTDVDTSRGTFTLVALHPAGGLKLLELSGDADVVQSSFAAEEFSRWDGLAEVVADDTRGIYFDRVPAEDATVSKGRYRIYFRQPAGDGEIEHIFAGSSRLLVEKRYYENGSKVWSASYYEYRREGGKLYPGGIILENHQYGYQLVVRLKEIRS